MVYYNSTAEDDFFDILSGLVFWDKHPLEIEHAIAYVKDIRKICDGLDKKFYHADAVYFSHKRYGKKVYSYKRNNRTTWYIVYNLDRHGNVFVNKIISNYLTIE